MIGFIEGSILASDGKKVLVQAKGHGLGYEVNFTELLSAHSSIALYTHHHITDSDQSLWGFRTFEEKSFFELLKSVNKVGASKAFALLATLGTEEIVMAIQSDSPSALAKAPGIGKKMAEQIILSLRDKVKNIATGDLLIKPMGQSSSVNDQLFEEALMALDSLGYKDSQVTGLVKKFANEGASSSQDIIKLVLREM